jgi:imidazolonepropionase-like amidohydrolase
MISITRMLGAAAMALLAAVPAGAQDGASYAITGAEAHTLTGPSMPGATVVIENGVITAVGTDVDVPAEAQVIDATGMHVYPGLFDAMTTLGLTEVGQVDVTNDYREYGPWNPHLVAATAVHPASEHIPVARANGVTHAVTAPSSGGGFRGGGGSAAIPGQGTLINLDGWTVEEMEAQHSVGLVINWPTIQTTRFNFQTFNREEIPYREAKEAYDEQLEALTEWIESARHQLSASQAGSDRIPADLKLEALAKAMAGEISVIIRVDGEKNIRNAVEYAEEQGFDFVLASARGAWKVADLLAEKDIPVILGTTQSMPTGDDESYDEAYANPGKLHAAGVRFAIASFGSSNVRTLPYEAAQAVPFGLPRDEALLAITLRPAEILGIDDRFGTIAAGKVANLIVTDGDPLEIQTRVQHLIIDGVPVATDNKHDDLADKYRGRYAN